MAFEGPLPSTVPAIPVRIEILDWDFVTYPCIELLSDPEQFRPHVNDKGDLCYLGAGTVVFDRHQPLENLVFCLNAAADELNRQASQIYRHEESQYEFVRYWGGKTLFSLIGTVSPLKRLHFTKASILNEAQYLISDNEGEIRKIHAAILDGRGIRESKIEILRSWVISLDIVPWLDRNGSPSCWGELWAWLQMVDQRAADCLHSVIDHRDFAESENCVIIFRHENKFFGVKSTIPEDIRETRALVKFKRGAPSGLWNFLVNHQGKSIKIETFEVMEVGEEFIHRRNLGMTEGLDGLRIHLIGAGAIGGFVAQQLARLGAGTNGGLLQIVDHDLLCSENVGRHLLGIDALLQPKATAVAKHLVRQFPLSNINGQVKDVRRIKDIFDCDIIIDATGEEALSLVLNELHQERISSGAVTPPMFFSWVLANGEVVQCLLSDGGNHACYDCLNLPDQEGLARQRFPILKEPPDTELIGCHTMRPYAVTAPTAAAALTAQMVMDWKIGHPKPRLRTLYLGRGVHLNNIKNDADPERLSRCLTCSKT